MKEVIKRFLEKNIETTTVPISENIFLNLGPGVSEVELGGIMKILGGDNDWLCIIEDRKEELIVLPLKVFLELCGQEKKP